MLVRGERRDSAWYVVIDDDRPLSHRTGRSSRDEASQR